LSDKGEKSRGGPVHFFEQMTSTKAVHREESGIKKENCSTIKGLVSNTPKRKKLQ